MATPFWHLAHLSDVQLLQCLQRVLHTKRRAMAELVAHLGEVEERRLHLQAACSSLFSYCVHRLGMSEDEACRRIEVARLARRFPALFAELASGGLTLSVALLLKRHLSEENHLELIGAVRGASTERARELLAARFPSPDVPSGIRKLPERRNPASQPANAALPAQATASSALPVTLLVPVSQLPRSSQTSHTTPPMAASSTAASSTAASSTAASPARGLHSAELLSAEQPTNEQPANEQPSKEVAQTNPPPPATVRQPERSRWQQRIKPLSAGRYRVQFTADTCLKRKLEQARDLLRHAQPDGDLGAVVSRALDCLLDELMRRRFGTRKQRAAKRSAATSATPAAATPAPVVAAPTSQAATPAPVMVATASQAATPAPMVAAATPQTAIRTPVAAASCAPAATATATPRTDVAATPTPPVAVASSNTGTATPTTPAQAVRGVEPGASSHIARSARRAVLERDGLGCSWVDAEGRRCGSTAWLELDHRRPAGRGGGSEAQNLRMLCRAHNRFAAERAYGRAHVERAVRARQRSAPPRNC